MSYPLPATGYTINVFAAGLPSKLRFYKTLGSQSAWRPPNFVDFLSTNSSRQNPTPADIWVARQVKSGRSGLGGQGLGLGLGGLGLGG